MTAPYVLPTDRVAAWARTKGVRLPDPIDVTQVDAFGVEVPADDPMLSLLADCCSAVRATLFSVELVPGRTETVDVVVAAERSAVLVHVEGPSVSLTQLRPDELVRSMTARLPQLAPMPQAPVHLSEEDWNRLLHQVATDGSPRSVGAALQRSGIGEPLARAMLAAKQRPVPIGLVGAAARADAPGAELRRGPTMASWFAHRGGAVLAVLLAPRRGGPRTVQLEPYTPAAAARALAEALPAAHRAAEVAHFGASAHARSRAGE